MTTKEAEVIRSMLDIIAMQEEKINKVVVALEMFSPVMEKINTRLDNIEKEIISHVEQHNDYNRKKIEIVERYYGKQK